MSSLPSKSWNIQLRELVTSPIAIIALTCVLGYVAYMKTRTQHATYDDEDYENAGYVKLPTPLKGLQLTRKQLAKYNCKNKEKTYLVALDDVIYDVSRAPRDFGPGGKYATISGTDLRVILRKLASLEMRDYEAYLEEWRMRLQDFFYVAGLISDEETSPEDNEVVKMDQKLPKIVEEKEAEEELEKELEKKAKEELEKELEKKAEEELDKELEKEGEKQPEKQTAFQVEIEIPEISLKDLATPEEGNNSDCDSLRTAYDCLPGQDDRDDEVNDDEDEDVYCEASQGAAVDDEISGDAKATDAEVDQSLMWNETDATMVATR